MSSLYKQFETNKDVENDGIVLEYGMSTRGPISIRISRAGGANTRFAKLMEAKVKPYRRQVQNETMDKALAEKIAKEVYAETVVIGWENVEMPVIVNGEATKELEFVPYTVENAIRLFTDLPDLYADIVEQAQRSALFRADIMEADSKN